ELGGISLKKRRSIAIRLGVESDFSLEAFGDFQSDGEKSIGKEFHRFGDIKLHISAAELAVERERLSRLARLHIGNEQVFGVAGLGGEFPFSRNEFHRAFAAGHVAATAHAAIAGKRDAI